MRRRNFRDSDGRDETRYLVPLQEFVARGITPAEELLERLLRAVGAIRGAGVHGVCVLRASS
jgi:gamma-glutamylcysteine synthetase